MENNQYDILNDAMKQPEPTQSQQQYSHNSNCSSAYESVDPSAERFLDGVNTTLKIIGIILACIGVIASIVMANELEEGCLIGIFGSLFMLIMVLIAWATIKVFINISRNLFNINNRLEQIENKLNK